MHCLVFGWCSATRPTVKDMKATLNGTVLAEADDSDVVSIEGNWYFAPHTVKAQFLDASPTQYTCSWKGSCQFYTVQVDGEDHVDQAWAYPDLIDGATNRVGRDFAGFVAFGREVSVTP